MPEALASSSWKWKATQGKEKQLLAFLKCTWITLKDKGRKWDHTYFVASESLWRAK